MSFPPSTPLVKSLKRSSGTLCAGMTCPLLCPCQSCGSCTRRKIGCPHSAAVKLATSSCWLTENTFSDLFINTPCLRRINLDYPNYDYPSWKIDWSLITVVQYSCPLSLYAFISPPRQATAIEELAIYGSFPIRAQLPDVLPVAFLSLEVLHTDSIGTLSVMETPSLEELSIGDENWPVDPATLESITFNFFRPLHHLKELVLRTWDVQRITAIVKNLPEVYHLSFHSRTNS